MQAAAGSVSWVAAQPSVLGRCGGGGGGAQSASVKGRAGGGGGGGGGASVRGVGVVRCSTRAQEKRPPRVRKSKEERREMVESFINSYRVANDGKFPSVNLTHKEVGGSYYIVREIVRDVIQENRVLGPGGLDSMALSFEDCPDSSEVSMKHELGQDNIESLAMSDDGQAGQGSVSESSSSEESFSLQNNSINTDILLGSSNILEAGVLKSIVQNGTASGTAFLETNLEKQDEVPSGGSIEVGLNSSEEQDPFSLASDSYKDIALNSQEDAHEGMGSVATDILSSEATDVYETNGALLREHEMLPNDSHGGSNDSVVDDGNLLAAANGALQEKQASFQEHDPSNESVQGDVQSLDCQISTTLSANPINGFDSEAEVTTKTIEASDTKGLLHTEDQHSVVQVDGSEFKKSTSGFTKEVVEATDARHEQGMSTTTVISRHALCLLTLRCMLTVYNFLHTSQKATVY
ncbi:hypothetical protein SEVIR_3G365400v4 [Setaria viridis]|uniref:AT3G52170-like helix-turn-helix domain-containing protein n=1 Tax=Setaria viridis TaxID=4556 RepID=A0A4U6VL81_SETVI|nr:uncharacterized protein LOC117846925 isoform X2 [Setaria viridis]TKW28983.1 hypothetical protein SEVIR_3G365400v2 [Setaria viridis]